MKGERRERLHRNIYIASLIILAIGLPLSEFLTSASQIILALNWIFEGCFSVKWQKIKENKILHIFLLLYLIPIIGLSYTSNFSWAFHDLKIKLPLFLIPILIVSSKKLSNYELLYIVCAFIFGNFVGTVAGMAAYTGLINVPITDIRDISLFISHIRFSLMIVLSISIILYLSITYHSHLSKRSKVLLTILAVWLVFFLAILQSLTGWITLIVSFYSLFFYFRKSFNPITKNIITVVLIAFPIASIFLLNHISNQIMRKDEIHYDSLPTATSLGNKYTHYKNSSATENGHYIWINICQKELEPAWNERSTIPYNQLDQKGHPIKYTLIRYLTSLNLPKDKSGVERLNEADISTIEKGYANIVYTYKFKPYSRLHEFIWEIHQYMEYNYFSGSPTTMRIEFLKNGWNIFKMAPWFGIGTGDIKLAFEKVYEESMSKLPKQYRLRSHNQYLTFAICFGTIGLIVILFSMLYPLIRYNLKHKFLFVLFVIILLLSMLNEDTLETQAGVTFAAFFYSLFLFSRNYD